jgi:hypothetical protein
VIGDVPQSERVCLSDQQPEDASPVGKVTDRGALLGRDPSGHEVDQLPIGSDYPQRRVAGPGQLDSQLDDPLQHRVEIVLGRQLDARPDQLVTSIDHVRHLVSLA